MKTVSGSYAVGIVHYGEPTLTFELLAGLEKQLLKPSAVVVVDNQCLPESTWAPALARGVTILWPRANLGYAEGVNRCVDWTRKRDMEFLWILNADVQLDPLAGFKFVESALSISDWDILGSVVVRRGRVWFGGGGYSRMSGRAWHEQFGAPMSDVQLDGRVRPTEWINGCSMFINMRGRGAARPLDGHLFLYREELEWQRRNPPLKARILCSALVEHEAGATTGGATQGLGRVFMSRNCWILATRQRGVKRLTHFAAWAFEFLVHPAVKRDGRGIREAVLGVQLRNKSGLEVLERI